MLMEQSFGGTEFLHRLPSAAEERLMAYLAIIGGASGLMFYEFGERSDVGAYLFPGDPSLLAECRRLATELQHLAPALLSGLARPDVESSQQLVPVAAWREADGVLVVAVNTGQLPLS